MLNVQTDSDRTLSKTVDLGESGSFEVLLKKPTWEEFSRDAERPAGYASERLRACVIDWKNIQLDGQETPFSWENFQRLCEAVPAVFQIVSMQVSELYFSFGSDDQKNSAGASKDS